MRRNWQFSFPSQIQFGRGGLRRLGAAVRPLGARALLVTYAEPSPVADICRQATASLASAGVEIVAVLATPPEPSVDVVDAGAALAKDSGAKVVVAIGGGSAIDLAKGVALLAGSGGRIGEYSDTLATRREIGAVLPIVAVPTTAGTGAEVTNIAVFGDLVGKISITAPPLRPRLAVVDPEVTLGCPAEVTAACGADALAHAIESCMSRAANPLSTALAVQAVGLIVENLSLAVNEPGNRDAREALSAAATLAGLALSDSGVTMTHAIAHALGAEFGLAHGRCVALCTPLNLRYNAEATGDVLAMLAGRCGLAGAPAADRAAAFVERIGALLAEFGLTTPIAVAAGQCETLAQRLAANALSTTPMPLRLNPRPIEQAALAELIRDELLVTHGEPGT